MRAGLRRTLTGLGGTVVLAASIQGSGVPFRVADLNTSVGTGGLTCPEELSVVPGRAVFSSSLLGLGDEPWVSDGMPAGGRLLRDVAGGAASSSPWFFVPAPGGTFFTAKSPGVGEELWWTDGTSAATRLVADVRPGRFGSRPLPLELLGGIYLFSADDGLSGRELWRSDGTSAETSLVADIRQGSAGSLPDFTYFHSPGGVLGDAIYFAADDGIEGLELWRSDGTPAGTSLVKSIVTGVAGGAPTGFLAAGERLFFSAEDPVHGRELWVTDGTTAGTQLVGDLYPGAEGSWPEARAAFAGRLLFAAQDLEHGHEFWVSDGTAAGTRLLRDIRPGPDGSVDLDAGRSAVELGAMALFSASDGIHGTELWSTDGTENGTVLVDDLVPGPAGSVPGDFFAFGGAILFGAFDPDGNAALWRTQGSAASTQELQPVDPWAEDFELRFVSIGGQTLLTVHSNISHWWSCALWKSDGTAAGTTRVSVGPQGRTATRFGLLAARSPGIVFATERPEYRIFRSDGSAAGTYALTMVTPSHGWFMPAEIAPLADGEVLVTAGHPSESCRLFRTDGDVLSVVRHFEPDPSFGSCPHALTPLADFVLFVADDWPHGTEPWRTDGTATGTEMLIDIEAYFGSRPRSLVAGFGKAWFATERDAEPRWSIWETGGTKPTTVEHPLERAFAIGPERIRPLGSLPERVTFVADGNLLALHPGAEEVQLLKPLSERAASFPGLVQTVRDATLHFFDLGPGDVCELWKSDGTPAGTERIAELGCRAASSVYLPEELVTFGDHVYYQSCEATHGCELWRSDGTAAGTARVRDLDPGAFSSSPSSLTPIGDRLYFVACDGQAGCEPWASDGTSAGTHRVGDVWPGPLPGVVEPHFTRSGDLIFFTADDGTGTELWAMPVELFYDGFETGDVTRWSGVGEP